MLPLSIDIGLCKVVSISQSFIHLLLVNGASAKAYVTMATGVGVTSGDHVTCCVLDVVVGTGEYWVSLNPKISQEEKGGQRGKQKQIAKYQSQFKVLDFTKLY